MSELPRPVVDAILLPTWTTGDPSRGVGLVRALLDAGLLVLMDDHMKAVRDRDVSARGWSRSAHASLSAASHSARLREALEAIAGYRVEHWEGLHLAAKAQAALDATEPAT